MESLEEKWYKTASEEMKVIVPEANWDRIQSEIGSESVAEFYAESNDQLTSHSLRGHWQDIASQMRWENVRARVGYRTLLIGLGITTLLMVLPFYTDMTKSFHQYRWSGGRLVKVEQKPESNESLTETSNAMGRASVVVSNDLVAETDTLVIEEGQVTSEEVAALIPLKKTSLLNSTPTIVEYSEPEKPKASAMHIPRKWRFGVITTVQSAGLLNPYTAMSMDKNTAVDNELQMGVAFGMVGRRKMRKKNFLEFAVLINDRKKQYSVDSRTGTPIVRETNINYSTMYLGYRHHLATIKDKASLGLVSGVFASYRYGLTETWGDEESSFLAEGYKDFDFGPMVGADLSIRLGEKMMLSTGVNYRFGSVNLFKGIEDLTSDEFRTHSSSLGLTTSLYYDF